MENQIIEAQVIKTTIRSRIWRFLKKDPLVTIGFTIIIVPFFAVGVANAYNYALQQYLETAERASAQTSQNAVKSCEALRQAYIEWKTENNIKPDGTDNCLTF